MKTLQHLALALLFGLVTLVFSMAALLVVLVDRRGRATAALGRAWARTILRVTGVQVELHGPPVPLDAPAYLAMANHTSHFDVVAIFGTLTMELFPVAKRELGYIPIFGWALRAGAAIMVDRGHRRRAMESIERAGRAIRGGRSVLMFPEGTRTPPGVLGPLKKGPFYLALSARVPVLPIGLTGTGEVLRSGDWRIHPGRVVLRIGTPIPTDGLPEGEQGRAELMRAVEAALAALMREDAGPRGQVA